MNRRPRLRQPSRGFTLVELMVSLVMGLIVALAAVALSRAATATFHEQVRISGVEARIRAASERLRNDLARASFMSTPNIQWDPKVAKVPGGDAAPGAPYRVNALSNLTGIQILTNPVVGEHNGLIPHELILAGNLTSNDVYRGVWMGEGPGCGGGRGAQIQLNALADPAVRRMLNGETTDTTAITQMAELVFTPGMRMDPPVTDRIYAAQVMDMRGCFHYVLVCGVRSNGANTVIVDVAGDATRSLLTPEDTAGDVCGARPMEEVAIAPIHRVRWYIGRETDTRLIDPETDGDGSLKFNLYRQLLDANTSVDPQAGASNIGPPELVAEYAVDLKFGLSIDSSVGNAPGWTNLDFEDQPNDFAPWTARATTTASTPNVGPQRIRSVRYRLAFRTPFADRRADLLMPGGTSYKARYELAPGQFARVRTLISEVALFNQAKAVY
jgi:prepilin-type N-terminal cleavage/methylation domain-containing protein